MKLYWDNIWNNNEHFEFDDYIGSRAKNLPQWWKRLSMYAHDSKSMKELLVKDFDYFFKGGNNTPKSAKGCPAFINLWKQSFALKTPSDLFIKIYESFDENKKKKEWFWEWSGASPMIDISGHSDWQGGDLAKDNLILKMSWSFAFQATEHTQFQYVDPYIANPIHYRVVPGVIDLKKNSIACMNMVTLWPKKQEEYWIPAGSTLGYVQLTKPIKSFHKKDLQKELKVKNYHTHVKGDQSEYIAK